MKLHYPLNPTTGVEDPTQLPWTDGVPNTGQEGSFPPSAAVVEPMTELANLIALAGLTGTSADLNQVTRAVRGGQLDWDATDTGTADAVLCQISLPHTQLAAGLPFTFIKSGSANTGNAVPTLTLTDLQGNNGLTGTIVKSGGGALGKGDLPANALITVRARAPGVFAVVSMVLISDVLALIQANTRTLLRQNLTVYVRPDGSDNNTGLADTAAGAFKTPQGAYNAVVQLYILSGFTITIQLSKTYATQVLGSAQPVSYPGLVAGNVGVAGGISLLGDPAAPQNHVLTPVPAGDGSMTCCLSGIVTLAVSGTTANLSSIAAGTFASAFRSSNNGTINVGTNNIVCPVSNSNISLIASDPGATVQRSGTVTFSGGGTVGSVYAIAGPFGPISASADAISNFTFGQYYFVNGGPANAILSLMTYSGSNNTGARFLVTKNGTIDPGNVALSSIPASVDGSTAYGGQVVGWGGNPWTAYTFTPGPGTGSFGAASASGRYQRIGRIVNFEIAVTISSVGSAGGLVLAQLPPGYYPTVGQSFTGSDPAGSGKALATRQTNGTGQIGIAAADNSSAAVSGATLLISGSYEASA